ncbi:MAG: nitrile hydratase subunit beta [Betaproteobacteria bacterium]|nr:nitrile hydratase subunit beta [Betaproteobacteria bacterium]
MSNKPHYDRTHHAKMATGIGDPQCFRGMAGKAKFKEGDRVRIKDLPDLFYTRTMTYTRGAVGTIVKLVYESPAAEDEAFGNEDRSEWFYSIVFPQKELWPEYSDAFSNDTVETEIPERYLESA